MAYGITALAWATDTRQVLKEHFHWDTRHRQLEGIIEIDKSLFGRKLKYHKSNPNRGLKVS
jgi:hypothetical protein